MYSTIDAARSENPVTQSCVSTCYRLTCVFNMNVKGVAMMKMLKRLYRVSEKICSSARIVLDKFSRIREDKIKICSILIVKLKSYSLNDT